MGGPRRSGSATRAEGCRPRLPSHRQQKMLDFSLAHTSVLEDDVVCKETAARTVPTPKGASTEGDEVKAELVEIDGGRRLLCQRSVRLGSQIIGYCRSLEIDEKAAQTCGSGLRLAACRLLPK